MKILFFFVLLLLLSLVLCANRTCTPQPNEASLPVFPAQFPDIFNDTDTVTNWTVAKVKKTNEKAIPRNVFVSFKTKPAAQNDLDDELNKFINTSIHEGWNVYLHGHAEQIQFMERYYANTSLLWAIKLISPVAGASVSDVWRVAVLYAFGGMYIDDDAYWSSSLDSFVGVNDSLILTTESGPYKDGCYRKDFHLSRPAFDKTLNRSIVWDHYWKGRRMAQFVFFAKPRNPVLGRFLENIVEQLRLEYMEQSPIYRRQGEPKWKVIVCTTGPDIWTTSIYEMVLAGQFNNVRVERADFSAFGCQFKISEAKHFQARKSSHYYGMRTSYLSSYHPTCAEQFEGQLIEHDSKAFFLVEKGVKREFLTSEALAFANFSAGDAYHISDDANFETLVKGENMPAPPLKRDRSLGYFGKGLRYGLSAVGNTQHEEEEDRPLFNFSLVEMLEGAFSSVLHFFIGTPPKNNDIH